MENSKEYKTELSENNEENNEEKSEKIALLKGLFLGMLMMAIGFIIILLLINLHSSNVAAQKGYSSTELAQRMDKIYNLVETYYDGEFSGEDMADQAIIGFLAGVGDKYAEYYTAEEFAQTMQTAEGDMFYGIGVVGGDDESGYILIEQVYTDSPAYNAGLQRGDYITGIDGEDVAAIGWKKAMENLHGEEGTEVAVTYMRNGVENTVNITRGAISNQRMPFGIVDEENKVGYIYVSRFQMTAAQQFIDDVNLMLEDGMEKLIIDLRYNGGGDVDTTCVMLDRLLAEGTIVTMKGPAFFEQKTSDAENYLNIPIVVLVNEKTASASEIFAGALKDCGMATIVGKTTYGKGVVQRFYKMGDGSYIKLTSAKYYTPNGTCLDGVGITPDYEVEFDAASGVDAQFEKALEVIKSM
ncbi:MAG: S41 family peptidase [Lachnospiraceae bacterium]|nr:S41 family peptidase [Lachnospiraceae bacterium]